jgi:hypothetical protein
MTFSPKTIVSSFVLLLTVSFGLCATTPAFPGAEGGGMYVTGGRGGTVYYVNTLEDNSTGNSTTHEGSLRWCLGQSDTRTILFKVSGLITLNSQITISKGNVTIAGQTAPGDGICLRNYTTSVKATNIIIRYIRFRLGDEALQESDAIWGRYQSDIILDHCSMSWCVDECASFYSNKNFTMQWCLLAESLRNSVHDKGAHGYGGIWGGENATFHHNMLAHHDSRNPRFNGWKRSGLSYSTTIDEERLDFRNNVLYNWGANSIYGGESAGHYNVVNNYYKYGPATSDKYRIVQADVDAGTTVITPRYGQYYITGNYVYGYPAVTIDNTLGIYNKTGASLSDILVAEPYTYNPVTTHSAEKAFEKVIAYVGCSLKRDTVDARVVQEALKGTYTYAGSNGSTNGLIDTQSDVGGWPVYRATTAPTDTDIDGIPDDWEAAHGLDSNNAADGVAYTLDASYTNLEVYLNSLVASITNSQNEDGSSVEVTNPSVSPTDLIRVYQNRSGQLELQSAQLIQSLTLYFLDACPVARQKYAGASAVALDVSSLKPGLYILKVQFENGSEQMIKVLLDS